MSTVESRTLKELVEIGDYAHLLATLGILFSILCNQDCYGISAKSHVLYTLINTINCFFGHIFVITIAYVVISYCTLFSLYCFKRTYQKEHYNARIDFLIYPCALLYSLSSNNGTSFMTFSLSAFSLFIRFLGMVATVPQFQFVMEAKKIRPSVFFLISAEGCRLTVNTVYMIYDIYDNPRDNYNNDEIGLNTILVQTAGFYILTIIALGICCCGKEYQQVEVVTNENHV